MDKGSAAAERKNGEGRGQQIHGRDCQDFSSGFGPDSWGRYATHMQQFYQKQQNLQSLVDEWQNGPCGGSSLPPGAADWLKRDDPFIEHENLEVL